MLYNKHRPKLFSQVVGQAAEIAVMEAILGRGGKPPHLVLSGGYGQGKTSLARLFARSVFCANKVGIEPCGKCEECIAMDNDNHIAYMEIDSAAAGQVADMRLLKDEASYRTVGGQLKIIVLDEAHVISFAGQNSLLQILESGKGNFVFVFCTTDPEKILPTIRSRCVGLHLKLLTVSQIEGRLSVIAQQENMKFESKALRIIATYVRGHMRDAVVLLEQVHLAMGEITEEGVRAYLRFDKKVKIYEVLTEREEKCLIEKLEDLLCTFSLGEIVNMTGHILLDVVKMGLGVGVYDQVDVGWMRKIAELRSKEELLEMAEKIMNLRMDATTITYGVVALLRVFGTGRSEVKEVNSGKSVVSPNVGLMRKQKSNG